MNPFITYIIQTTVAVSLFYLLYWLFLRKETFFGFNRYYFTISILTSLALPFLDLGRAPVLKEASPVQAITGSYYYLENNIIPATSMTGNPETPVQYTLMDIVTWIYIAIAAFLLFRLFFQAAWFARKIRKSQRIEISGMRIVLDENVVSPFSFFSWIFMNPGQAKEEKMREILLHEKEHIRQRHSLDLVLTGLLVAFQWFNPFAWMLRRSVKETLEYLADRAVLRQGVPMVDYQKLLLSYALGLGHPALITPLNFSLNKKRMIMMKKMRSPDIRKWKGLAFLPLVLILGLAFSSPFRSENISFVKRQTPAQQVSDSLTDWPTAATYYVLNGEEISRHEFDSAIATKTVNRLEIVEGKNAINRFGPQATGGALIISTNTTAVKKDKKTENPSAGLTSTGNKFDSVKIRTETPVYILNGKVISKQEFKSLDPESIKAVEVLKGEKAVERYGSKAEPGAIIITTKDPLGNRTQTYRVTGRVINAESNEPLPDVNIVVKNTNRGTVSGEAGKFSLPLEKESQEVYFTYIGFKPLNREMKNGEEVEVRLQRRPVMLILPPATRMPWEKIAEEKKMKSKPASNPEFVIVELMPEFRGGRQAFSNYISSEINYPRKAKKNNVSGRVWVNFTIDKGGNVRNVYLDRGIDPDLDKEAIRIISGMPKWKPGRQRGKAVPVELNINVDFVL